LSVGVWSSVTMLASLTSSEVVTATAVTLSSSLSGVGVLDLTGEAPEASG